MSDEVSQFLEQVERLRGQQIEDDEARAREREEFLAAKRERQARREGESATFKWSKVQKIGSTRLGNASEAPGQIVAGWCSC